MSPETESHLELANLTPPVEGGDRWRKILKPGLIAFAGATTLVFAGLETGLFLASYFHELQGRGPAMTEFMTTFQQIGDLTLLGSMSIGAMVGLTFAGLEGYTFKKDPNHV